MKFPFKWFCIMTRKTRFANWHNNWKTSKNSYSDHVEMGQTLSHCRTLSKHDSLSNTQSSKDTLQPHTHTHARAHLFMQPTQQNPGVNGKVVTRHTEQVTVWMPINAQTGKQLCCVGYMRGESCCIYRMAMPVHTAQVNTSSESESRSTSEFQFANLNKKKTLSCFT